MDSTRCHYITRSGRLVLTPRRLGMERACSRVEVVSDKTVVSSSEEQRNDLSVNQSQSVASTSKEEHVPEQNPSSSLAAVVHDSNGSPASRFLRTKNLDEWEPIREPVGQVMDSHLETDQSVMSSPVVERFGELLRHRRGGAKVKRITSRREYSVRSRPVTPWLIPAEHPLKILWDVLTVLLSLANAYATHAAIRDRQFGSVFLRFCECWFIVDILLNFATERQVGKGVILRNYRAVWARYLTTWFVIDALSLVPGELLYVQPIIERQNRRGLLKKLFFRSRAVVRVTRVLRGYHFQLFGRVARQTRRAGVGANRLLRVIIKYVPKYLLFLRNMRAVIAVRVLRQVHWFRNIWITFSRRNQSKLAKDDETHTVTDREDEDYDFDEDDEDDDSMYGNGVQIVYEEDWDFTDDGDPY